MFGALEPRCGALEPGALEPWGAQTVILKNYLTTKARMKTNSIAASSVKNFYLSSFLFSDLKFSKILFFFFARLYYYY